MSLDLLKHLKREPAKRVCVGENLVKRWTMTKAATALAKETEDTAYRILLERLDDAEIGDCGLLGELTFFSQNSNPKVDSAKLRADGVFDKYCTQGTHRVLRFKPRKEKE